MVTAGAENHVGFDHRIRGRYMVSRAEIDRIGGHQRDAVFQHRRTGPRLERGIGSGQISAGKFTPIVSASSQVTAVAFSPRSRAMPMMSVR